MLQDMLYTQSASSTEHASSSEQISTTDRLLVQLLSRFDALGNDVHAIRGALESVEASAAGTTLRMDRIEQHLRHAAPAASGPSSHPLLATGRSSRHSLVVAALAVCSWLLCSRRGRQLLRRIPLAAILSGQVVALGYASCLRVIGTVESLSFAPRDTDRDEKSQRRQRRMSLALYSSAVLAAILPTKALAHVWAALREVHPRAALR